MSKVESEEGSRRTTFGNSGEMVLDPAVEAHSLMYSMKESQRLRFSESMN
jgi:hypothetical protein